MTDLTGNNYSANGMLTPAPPLAPRNYGPSGVGRPIQFRMLLHRKWTLLLFAVTGLLLGIVIARRMPYVYQGRILLEVQGINQNLLNRQELDPSVRSDNSSQSYVNTEARLLESAHLLDRVAHRMNTPSSTTPLSGHWVPPITRAELASNVRVVTRDTDRIIEVDADSRDPRRASAMANAMGEEFIQQDLEARWQTGQNVSKWLTKELSDLADKLSASEQELQNYTQHSNLLIDDGQGSVAETRLRELQDQLAHAQDDRISKEALYENATNTSQPATLTNNTVEQYEIQLTTLQKQLAELEATYSPGYYKIPPLKAQIASIQKALAQQRQVALNRVANDYRAAQRREKLLRAQYNAQFRVTADETAKIVRFTALKKAVDTNRQIYEAMLQKVNGYSAASAIGASNVRLVDTAEVPRRPQRPNKPMIALLTAFGFFCAGVCWTMIQAAGSHRITEPGETQHFLRSPELGVIPAAKSDPMARRAVIAGGTRLWSGSRRGKRGVETVTWKCSPSLMAESFRSTSASLLLPWRDDQRGHVVLVTSMSPSEGKTTVASNLAIAMAGAAGRVLLVDADRRRPRLHTVFDRSNRTGLGEFLCSDRPIDSARNSIVSTAVSNLFLLPNGTAMVDTPEVLYSSRMADLISSLREKFDMVIIDTPPLLHLSDARVIGRLSDGVILVFRAGHVRWESAMAAEKRLAEDGIPILGTVLNDWSPDKDGYGVYPDNKAIYSYIGS